MAFEVFLESIADLWAAVQDPPPLRARDRIQREFARLQQRDLSKEGLSVDLIDNHPGKWRVVLFNFSLAGTGPGSDLDADLVQHNTKFGSTRGITIEVTFPDSFPSSPPQFYVRHPILTDGTANVVSGVCVLPALIPEGWDDHYNMRQVLGWIRDSFLRSEARVDMASNNAYPRAAFNATLTRMNYRPKPGAMETAISFNQKLYAYSGTFARKFLDVPVSGVFQAGNKAYLPEKVLKTFQSQAGRGGDASWLTHTGMIFEVTNHLRIAAYCGVREFVTPEDDMIILPDWMHRNLFLREGIEVQVRSVAPPKLAFVTVQPHQSWEKVTKAVGLDGQTFLQLALGNYVSVSMGDQLVLSVGDCSMTVNIISTRPKAPVCALFTNFETQVGLDFLPARDAEFATSEEDARAAARQPSRQGGAAGGSEESKDTQDTRNQDFVQAHAYRQQELQRREAALERSGITVPGTDRDKPTVTMRLNLVSKRHAIKCICNTTTPCKALYKFIRETYPTHKGGGTGAPFTLRLRGVKPEHSVLPDDDTTVAHAHVAKRSVVDQDIVLSTTCIGCPPPSKWACSECTFEQPLCDECEICGHERNDADKLVGSGGAVRSYVVAKPGGTTGRFEVEVVGLCPAHTPAWLKSLQASGVPFADEDFHLVTRDTVLSTMQSELI